MTDRAAAARGSRPVNESATRAGQPVRRGWLYGGLSAAVLVLLAVGYLDVPREGAALPAIARYAMVISLPLWKSTEPVSEVVYGTRGFDTFGETMLLLAAVISASALSRHRERRHEYVGEAAAGRDEQQESDPYAQRGREEREARGAEEEEQGEMPPQAADVLPLGTPGPERSDAMTVIVRVAARAAALMLAVMSVYIFAWNYTPGSGFVGGTALAGVAILLYAALGYRAVRRVVRPAVLEPVELASTFGILLLELLGLLLKGSFSANWVPLGKVATIQAGGVLHVFSSIEFLAVASGLTVAIFVLLGMRHEWTPDEPGSGEEDEQ